MLFPCFAISETRRERPILRERWRLKRPSASAKTSPCRPRGDVEKSLGMGQYNGKLKDVEGQFKAKLMAGLYQFKAKLMAGLAFS